MAKPRRSTAPGKPCSRSASMTRLAASTSTAVTLTRQTGGKREQARALTGLGAVCYRQGQLDRAAGFHQDALALYQDIGDPGGQAAALNGSGETQLAAGQPGQALSLSSRCADAGPPDRGPL